MKEETEKLTQAQSERIYRTLLDLLGDQLGVEVRVVDIKPGSDSIEWR